MKIPGESIHGTLQGTFGFPTFRGRQEEVILAVLAGRSALAIFPTGGGKSLCYQLPALHLEGLTLVVSPLIALMKDQIDFLERRGVAAARFDSSLTGEEVGAVYRSLDAGALKLLYISPERLANERFLLRIAKIRIAMLVVDEAHCISEWGHNFRPDYLKLARAAERIKAERILALTATATPKVGADICRVFKIATDDWYQETFHRPNLELHLTPLADRERLPFLVRRLKERPVGPSIVYVTLQRTAEWLAGALAEKGFEAIAYHAGMEAEERHRVQDAFMASDRQIVVATIAFGMGIDKANIRAVYHFNQPKSLENYAQEIGRAGRDGAHALCEVLLAPEDRIVLENFSYGDTPTREALAGTLAEIFTTEAGAEIALDLYALSRRHDIRPLVLATLLTWLELRGMLDSIGAIPAEVRFKAERPSAEILAAFDPERAAFLKRIFAQVKRGREWLNLDVMEAGETLGERPARIVKALNYIEAQGMIALEPKRFRQLYRVADRPADLNAIVAGCAKRFAEREQADLARLGEVISLAASEACRTATLLAYFGETLNEGRCGHCDRCLGVPVAPVENVTRPEPTAADRQAIAALYAEGHNALVQPRQLTRFLAGLSSPATSRDRLGKHPAFGSLERLPFAALLAACEEAKRLSQLHSRELFE